jgi:hypothetical protein
MTPTIDVHGITITAPPGVLAFIDDGALGEWVTDLHTAQLLALMNSPHVTFVDVWGASEG